MATVKGGMAPPRPGAGLGRKESLPWLQPGPARGRPGLLVLAAWVLNITSLMRVLALAKYLLLCYFWACGVCSNNTRLEYATGCGVLATSWAVLYLPGLGRQINHFGHFTHQDNWSFAVLRPTKQPGG